MNKNIGDMTKEELYDLCNELLDKDTEYMLIQRKIDKAIEYIKETELYQVVYDDEGNYFNTYDDKATADLLQILGDKE